MRVVSHQGTVVVITHPTNACEHGKRLEIDERLTEDEPAGGEPIAALASSSPSCSSPSAYSRCPTAGCPAIGRSASRGRSLAVTLAKPALLAPFHQAWFQFDLLLRCLVHLLVMATIHRVVPTPTCRPAGGRGMLRGDVILVTGCQRRFSPTPISPSG